MKKIFVDDDVNVQRQNFLDIAKFLAIFFMVLIHIVMYSGFTDTEGLFYLITSYFTGGLFAAPVFMFCMGIGISYSRNSNSKAMFKRGGELFIKAWGLNLVRSGLPFLILFLIFKDEFYWTQFVDITLILDILHFAAVAFLLFALLKKLKLSDFSIFILGIVLSIIGSFVRFIDFGNDVLGVVFGHIIGISGGHCESCFPLLNWFIFVSSGNYFGKFLKRCVNLKYFFLIVTPISFIITALYCTYSLINTSGIFVDNYSFYQCTFIDAVFEIFAIFFFLGICYFLSQILSPNIIKICENVSKNINEIYIIHWIIIFWFINVPVILFNLSFGIVEIIIATIILFPLSAFLANQYTKLKNKRKSKI